MNPFTSNSNVTLQPLQPQLQLPLVLENLNNVHINARGCSPFVWGQHSSPITIRNCNRITLEGFTLIGPGPLTTPNKNYYAAVELAGVNNQLTFRDCSFDSWGNHGIAHLTQDRTSTNVLVERCRFTRGGNYGRTDGLVWDGAAIAVGGKGVRIFDCVVDDWCRGLEFENPYSDCSFTVDQTRISNCPHASIWITPTGFLQGIKGQVFSGRLTNTTIGPGRIIPNGFLPTGVCCTGGQDIQVSGLRVFGMPNGCGLLFAATTAPITRVQLYHNLIRDIGRSGILYRNGSEGTKDKVSDLVCSGNMLTQIVGTPLDVEPGILCDWNLTEGNNQQAEV